MWLSIRTHRESPVQGGPQVSWGKPRRHSFAARMYLTQILQSCALARAALIGWMFWRETGATRAL